MSKYPSWPTTDQGNIVGGRLANEMYHRFTGALNALSNADQKDAALAELLATTGEVFNIKSFGAKGDGTTDDTAAIRSTIIAAITVGGRTYIPSTDDSYNITSIVITNAELVTARDAGGQSTIGNVPIIMFGDGKRSKILVTNTMSAPGFHFVSGSMGGEYPQVILHDFTMEGTTESCGDAIIVEGGNQQFSVIERVFFRGFANEGTGTTPNGNDPSAGVSGFCGLRLKEVIALHVKNCFFHDVNSGIILQGQSDAVEISHCGVYYLKRAGIEVVAGFDSRDSANKFRCGTNIRLIHNYFFGSRVSGAGLLGEGISDDTTLGFAGDGSDNGRWCIKTESGPRIHIDGNWIESTEWAIFLGDYEDDLISVGGDGAGSVGSMVSSTRGHTDSFINNPTRAGSHPGKIYLYRTVDSYLNIISVAAPVLAGNSSSNYILKGTPLIETFKRQLIDGWYQDDVTTGQSQVELTRDSGAAGFTNAWIPHRAGSLTGIYVNTNDDRTAGILTLEVKKNGSAISGVSAVLGSGDVTFKREFFDEGDKTFAINDRLTLVITTDGSWAPTTADIRATIEIVFDQ